MPELGIVRSWDEDRGYGTIDREAGGEVLVLRSGLAPGVSTLHEGDIVSFDLAFDSAGVRAVNVTIRKP